MLYEWRIYSAVPGKINALNDRFEKHTVRLFEKHGIRPIGFWQAVVGTTNILYYMLAWKSMAEREKAWNSFQADPEWVRVAHESEKDGPIVQSITNILLKPTPYSSMK